MSDRTIRAVLTGSSAGAVRAFQEVESAANKASGNSASTFEKAGGRIGNVFKSIVGGAASIAVAYVGFTGIKDVVGGATQAFGDQQTATTLLNLAMKDMSQKWTPALKAQLATTGDAMLKFGDTNATTESAIQKLILRGVPAKQAMGDLGVIANIAATAHLSLSDAVDMVDKAVSGRMSPTLKELGATTLPKGVTGVKALNDILDQVAPHVAGAAGAVSKTMPGALAVLGSTITDKVMVPLGGFINKGLIAVSNWIGAHQKDIGNVLAGAMTLLGSAVNIVGGFMSVLVGVLTTLSNNHLLVPMVQTLVASFVIWKGIAVVGAIQGMMASIAGPGVAVSLVSVAAGVWAIAWPILAIAAVAASIVGLFTIMSQGGPGVARARAIVTKAAGSNPGHPTVGGPGGGIQHLVPRAMGGPVQRGRGYWVGENGPEPFYPDSNGTIAPTSGGGSPVGGVSVVINVVSNDGQAVVNALRRFMYSNGPIPITVNRARALGS